MTDELTRLKELEKRLREACNGRPARIAWPHNILHEAADSILALISKTEKLETALMDEAREAASTHQEKSAHT